MSVEKLSHLVFSIVFWSACIAVIITYYGEIKMLFTDLKKVWLDLKPNERKYLGLGLKATGLLGFISIVIFPILFTLPSYFTWVDYSNRGAVGDTVNGIAAPFIALFAALLTFIAFYVQYQANIQQRQQFNIALGKEKKHDREQEKLWSIERFESKFYSMLEIHRQNINEVEIGGVVKGRRAFLSMFNELKFTYEVVHGTYNYSFSMKKERPASEEALFNIAYFIFFFGFGPNSTKILRDLVGGKHENLLNILVFNSLNHLQNQWDAHNSTLQLREMPTEVLKDFNHYKVSLTLPYKPFSGHVSRFSHYIRHLFQMVKFVDTYPEHIIDPDAKQNYMAMLRAQLSVYEQLMIYYNSLSILGKPWYDVTSNGENLLEKYALVRSIPLPLADFYIVPKNKLGEKENTAGKQMFEWTEIHERMQHI